MMATNAFVVMPEVSQRPRALLMQPRPSPSSLALRMAESDFASAMPDKPKMSLEEMMQQTATEFIAQLEGRLGEGVAPPAELDALRMARDNGRASPKELTKLIYELMIEQGMTYDTDPETGIMTPTEWDIKECLGEPEVKREFLYLYQYGMNLIAKGLLDVVDVKAIVEKRLVVRTGKTPEEFDEWLGY